MVTSQRMSVDMRVSNVLFMVNNPQLECNDVTICRLSADIFITCSHSDGDQSKCHGLDTINYVSQYQITK